MVKINFTCSAIYIYLLYHTHWLVAPDSSVGTATRYGLDGPGIESP